MSIDLRSITIGGTLAVLVAGALASPALFPAAFADEPQKHLLDRAQDLFPAPFDPSILKKFDITAGPSLSTTVLSTRSVTKIAFGHRTSVAIVTTPSGVYSSDALVSPNVRYPGLRVTPKDLGTNYSFSTFATPEGTGSWTRVDSGSFIYMTYSFTPAARSDI